jgi:hypothetical protein
VSAQPWPKQQRLIAQLRDVLRREFGAQDAWVFRTVSGCRLDVRVAGRRIALLEAPEDEFWSRFYHPVERERRHLGERYVDVEQWRRLPADLAEILRPHWQERVGPPSP